MYKITIEKIEKVEREQRGEWTVVAQEPVPVPTGIIAHVVEVKNVYGYAPPQVQCVEEKQLLLAQEMEALDLTAVIRAVNGM